MAERDGQIVGTCRLLLDGGVARLGRMAVSRLGPRQGVGALLLEEADRVAAAAGAGPHPAARPGRGPRRVRPRRLPARVGRVHGGGHRPPDHGEAPCLSCAWTRCRGCARSWATRTPAGRPRTASPARPARRRPGRARTCSPPRPGPERWSCWTTRARSASSTRTELAATVEHWRERMRAHEEAAYVHLWADAAAAHLHALPFVPARVARERERFSAYRERTQGRNLQADLLQAEVRGRARVVSVGPSAVAVCPFAPAGPLPRAAAPARRARPLRGRRAQRRRHAHDVLQPA